MRQAPYEGGREAVPFLDYKSREKWRAKPIYNLQVYKVIDGPRLKKLSNEQEDFLFHTTFKVGCIYMP